MSGKSSIEWTNATWNPLVGCTQVSAGCDHCYALTLHEKRHKAWLGGTFPTAPAQYHKPFSKVQLIPARLEDPLRWRQPRMIFVNSVSDLFHADVPDEYILNVFSVMEAARSRGHVFQVLTKRPQRMMRWVTKHRDWVDYAAGEGEYLRRYGHVWLGTSVENQEAAFRLDFLARTPAAVRFVSAEPLLGPIDLHRWMPGLDWIITGGESGPGYRPCDPQWVHALRDQAKFAGAKFFFKQWGGITPKARGRNLDGRTWDEMPLPAPGGAEGA
jgi:protein gp37